MGQNQSLWPQLRRWRNCLDCLPPKKTSSVMSELQDKLDRGEISPQECHDQWDEQMAENERLHPGIHDRWFEYLMVKYPGHGVDADQIFA